MKAKDVRKGNVIIYKGAPHRVLDFAHRTPGNLRAFVQVRLRNVLNGIQVDDRFSSFDELEEADMSTMKASYLYADGTGYHFMSVEDYEQVALDEELVGASKYYLLEGSPVEISFFNERPIALVLPKTVELIVEETTPEMKGATATNQGKPAKTNTGLTVTVPPFVKIGEKIIVDTEDGSYLSRAE